MSSKILAQITNSVTKSYFSSRDSKRMSYRTAAILNQNLAYIPHILKDGNGKFGDKKE
jgi:hypothetical protein